MTSAHSISGRQAATVLIAAIASTVWISEILRWTYYDGKVPGSYMPDWMAMTWILCLLGSPIVSIILVLIIALDRRERFTPAFTAAIMYGFSPWLLFAYYLIVIR